MHEELAFYKRNLEKSAEEEAAGPRVFSDFFFMSTKERDDEKAAPFLATKFSLSGRIAATALEHKCMTP